MKNKLMMFAFSLMFVTSLLCGCQQGKKKPGDEKKKPDSPAVQDNDIPALPSTDVPSEVQINSLEVALIDKENKPKEFEKVQNFSVGKSGPYEAKDKAETAYIALRVNAEKPQVGDFDISVINLNTYGSEVAFRRGTGTQVAFQNARKNIPLAKGRNNLDITIKSYDKKIKGTYRVVVEYEGGPDFSDPKGVVPKALIDGIYCPAWRKGDDEKFLWIICIAGNCGYCPLPLNGAGPCYFDVYKKKVRKNDKGEDTGENLAQKFKDKGLRVVALEDGGSGLYNPRGAREKWNTSGRGYNMYTSKNNCFYEFCKPGEAVPQVYFFKEGNKAGERKGGDKEYAPFIKEFFGLE